VNAAARWTAELRPMDTIARYGGEEFLVLLPGCEVGTATVIADRLRAAVPERQTCSVGVAQWDGFESTASLIARADAALYVAKAAGRDVTVVADTVPIELPAAS
jgi:diguanylate cyclase (GGDEF)-like protein